MDNPATHFAPKPAKLARVARPGVPSVVCVSALAGVSTFVRMTFGEKVLRHANAAALLDIEAVEDQDCFIPHETMSAFVNAVSRRAGDPHFGLRVAPHLQFSNYGCWADYVLEADTLGIAFDRAVRSIGYHSQGDFLHLAQRNGQVLIIYASGSRQLEGYDQIACGTVGVILSLCRAYQSPCWTPRAIELDIPRPQGFQVFSEIFGCPVFFDAPRLAVVVEPGVLNSRSKRKPAGGLTTLEDIARMRLEPTSRKNLCGVVSNYIWTQVKAGQVSIDSTARSLNLSVRTLQRELNSNGIDFRSLVNELRSRRAIELLRGTNATITEISAELGYSAPAHFARAFRNVTGSAPADFRRASRSGEL